MKIRNGFVSNSSSSSFTCEISGDTEAMCDDGSLHNVDMVKCKRGHIFYDDYIINKDEDFDALVDCTIPEHYCPICQLKVISLTEREKYINKKYNITHEKIDKEIMEMFSSYDSFKKYIG